MQNTSVEFKTAIKQPSREIECRITFPDLVLDDYQIQLIDLDSAPISDDFEIGMAPMDIVKVELVEDTGDGWGRNLASKNNIGKWDSGWVEDNYVYTITGPNAGLYIKADVFETGERYVLTFKAKKISGTVTSLAGHCANYTIHKVIRDGVLQSTNWSSGLGINPYLDDEEVHDYEIHFTAKDFTESNNDFYIQPNRSHYGLNYVMKIWDLMLVKGNMATGWTPAPEDYANYDYKNKECDIELGLTLPDESVEYVSIGKFTVENAVRKNNRITLDCVDRMYKAEKEYISDLMYPTTLLDILQSASEQAGIPLATTTFANSDYIVPNEPVYEGVTCRKVFAQVAELAGGYAKINRLGQLEIVTLGNESVRDITKDHYFDLKINEVAEANIDKVIVKVGEETATKGDGENIYTVVDNMFVQDPNNVVDALYSVLKNVSYTACTLKWQGDFSLDLGDKVTVDGNDTYVLSRKLTYTGGLREDYSAPAKSNIEKESTGKGSLTLDIENVKTRVKVLSGEISQTIERVENLVVGANNRLFDSQTGIEFGFNNGSGTIQLFGHQIHPYYKVVSDGNIDLFAAFPDSQFAEPLGELGEVTISLEVLVEVDRKVNIDGKEFDVKGNRWTRIHVTKEFNEENTTKRLRVRNPFSRKHTRDTEIGTKLIESLSTNINTLYYRNLKVERGNVVTEWTLTPEELEQYVNRLSTEFKQLEDSISLVARRNELTGRFEVTPESIVAAINTTDGVGRVKNVGVTIDENGLTVENGAVIIRDAFNTAIITSNGLKVMYSFSSGGQYQGWQMVGIWGVGVPVIYSYEASMPVQIPEKLIIEKATLYAHCAPAYLTGYSNVPDGLYYPQNLALYVRDFDATVFDCPMQSSYGVWYGSGGLEISNAVWGGRWTPNGEGVVTKSGNVKNYLTPGERSVFVVQSTDSPTSSNGMRFGIMKFDLVIEGFLRG